MKPVLVIGMGNALMRDEGIGGRLASELILRGVPDEVEVMDIGTSWMSVLHALPGRARVIFIDCAAMGEPPGTLRRFTPDEVRTQKVLSCVSQHEGDLLNTLRLANDLGTCPKEVVLIGIQPDCLEAGDTVSEVLESRITDYLSALELELAIPLMEGVK